MGKRFKVVLVDGMIGDTPLPVAEETGELARVNAGLVVADCHSEDEIVAAARDADAILVIGADITRSVLEKLPKCQVIVRYGIGYDTIDVAAATDNNILLVNVPDFCLEEVSNHAIALLLVCAKKIVLLNNMIKRGSWMETVKARSPMGPICGQTLGLVGCGNIGRMTARKAQSFGLRIRGYDPYVDNSLAGEYRISLVSLPELLEESDFISVHAALNQETRHLIGEKELKRMKPTAYIINTARGSIIDEPALITALQEKWIAGAGLDVFEQEPVAPDNPLLKMDNVVVLPHSASYSDAAFKRLKTCVGQEAAKVLSGHWPKNVVNKTVKPKVKLKK